MCTNSIFQQMLNQDEDISPEVKQMMAQAEQAMQQVQQNALDRSEHTLDVGFINAVVCAGINCLGFDPKRRGFHL